MREIFYFHYFPRAGDILYCIHNMNQLQLDYPIYAFGDDDFKNKLYLNYKNISCDVYNKIYVTVDKKYKYQSEVMDQTIISNEGIYHNLVTGQTWSFNTNGMPFFMTNPMDFPYDNPIPFIINFNRKTYWMGGKINRYISFYSACHQNENKMMIVVTAFQPL